MPAKPAAAPKMFTDRGADRVYSAIVSGLRAEVGAKLAVEDLKQTCVHITAGTDAVAYAGLHPRKGAVLLTVRTQSPLTSPRVRKVEQVSRNRCHNDLLIAAPGEVDAELIGWLADAARLVAPSAGAKAK
jgi:hypothetical protein